MAQYRKKNGWKQGRSEYKGYGLQKSESLRKKIKEYFNATQPHVWNAPELTPDYQEKMVSDFITEYGNSRAVTGNLKTTSIGTRKRTPIADKIKNFESAINQYLNSPYTPPEVDERQRPVGAEVMSLGEFANNYIIERQIGKDIFKIVKEYQGQLKNVKYWDVKWSKGVVVYGDQEMPINMYDFNKTPEENFTDFISIDDDTGYDILDTDEPIDIKMHRRKQAKKRRANSNVLKVKITDDDLPF